MTAIHFGLCAMCLDISAGRFLVREAVLPRGEIYTGVEPFQIIAPLTLPGDDHEGVPLPVSDDDPLFQKYLGLLFKREEPS
jgi:hypothetical protein